MMNQLENSRKWACKYCTYENWPASKKCTLCRASRTPQLISEAVPEQNIYNIAPLVTSPEPPSPPSGCVVPPSLDYRNKWPCQACTYLNWPKSVKCSQCLTPRKIPVLTQSSSSTEQPLSINVSIATAASPCVGCSKAEANSPNRSPIMSPNSPEAAKAANNDRNKAIAASVITGNKWTCKACTYLNWPKSSRCVMCNVIRGKTYHSPSLDIMAASSADSEEPENNRRISSPVRDDDVGATAAAPVVSSKDPVSKSSELRQIRNRLTNIDWLWLTSCQGVVEGDSGAVEAYLASGGDPSRQLTDDECVVLNRPSAFEKGYTLVHLAIRFQREDMLALLLTATDVAKKAKKRVPSHVAPDTATEILREISLALRQRKGDFPCYFLKEMSTFVLPADVDDFPLAVRKQLLAELLDADVQKELEEEESVINWNLEITERLGSRLYALWNRTAGDCLLDSVLQASWGVFDRDNTLRRALADSLMEGANLFYPRWKEAEAVQAKSLQFSLDESQWQQDWGILLNIASQPGASLEQIHIFALAHILRRPIIVYGIKYVKSFRGENLGFARFQGVYLPLLWESSFCWKNPICLGYTRGHFSALVPMETDLEGCIGAGANIDRNEDSQVAYLPLMDCEGKLLPIHFLPPTELGREEIILREWLDCEDLLDGGSLLVARQTLPNLPILVKQMVDEWLERYRKMSTVVMSPPASRSSQNVPTPAPTAAQDVQSSDEDSDDE